MIEVKSPAPAIQNYQDIPKYSHRESVMVRSTQEHFASLQAEVFEPMLQELAELDSPAAAAYRAQVERLAVTMAAKMSVN